MALFLYTIYYVSAKFSRMYVAVRSRVVRLKMHGNSIFPQALITFTSKFKTFPELFLTGTLVNIGANGPDGVTPIFFKTI